MTKPKLYYLGIDPGKEGGLALIDEHEQVMLALPMPDNGGLIGLFNTINSYAKKGFVKGCLENVSASPQMGVTSAFTFGKEFGRVDYAIAVAGIPFELVRPQLWQKSLHIPPRSKDETQPQFKKRLVKIAQRAFPRFPLWTQPKTIGIQDSVADALLIALYCKRVVHSAP